MKFSLSKSKTSSQTDNQSQRLCVQEENTHLYFFCNQSVQPAGVNSIQLKAFGLQQFDQVFNCSSKITPNRQLLQSHHHISRGRTEKICNSHKYFVSFFWRLSRRTGSCKNSWGHRCKPAHFHVLQIGALPRSQYIRVLTDITKKHQQIKNISP